MSRARSDLRNWTVSEKNELKKYFSEHGWKYDPSIPSRIRMNGIPKAYNASSIILPIGEVKKNVPRWQMIEFLATGDVKHTPAECTAVYKPSDKEIISFHLQKSDAIKALRADMDRLEGVVDREVVSEGIQMAKAAVEAPKALETEESISCLYFSSVNMNPSNNLIEILFVEEETWRTAKVSSHHDRSFCALKDLPTGILCTSQRFEILKRDILDYLKSHDGGADSHWHFSGTVDSEGFLTNIDGH